jgi:hypothetical protein
VNSPLSAAAAAAVAAKVAACAGAGLPNATAAAAAAACAGAGLLAVATMGGRALAPSAAGSGEVLFSPGGGAACCCVVGRGALVSVRLGWLYLHMMPNLHMAYWL